MATRAPLSAPAAGHTQERRGAAMAKQNPAVEKVAKVIHRIGDIVEYWSQSHNTWIQTEIVDLRSDEEKVLLRCHRNRWTDSGELRRKRQLQSTSDSTYGQSVLAPSVSSMVCRSGLSSASCSLSKSQESQDRRTRTLSVLAHKLPESKGRPDWDSRSMAIAGSSEGAFAFQEVKKNKRERARQKLEKEKRRRTSSMTKQCMARRPTPTTPLTPPTPQTPPTPPKPFRWVSKTTGARDDISDESSSHPNRKRKTVKAESTTTRKRLQLGAEISRSTEPQAKKSRSRPKQAGPAPATRVATPSMVTATATAVVTASARPDSLSERDKKDLQKKVEELDDRSLETVRRFLEADIDEISKLETEEEQQEDYFDLDRLDLDRLAQLVRVVDEELTKQRVRHAAAMRGEPTPPESPMMDIGRNILTPLVSPPLTAARKAEFAPPMATPEPKPTPSDCGEEMPFLPFAAQRQRAEKPRQDQEVSQRTRTVPGGREAGPERRYQASPVLFNSCPSISTVLEDAMSRSARKAMKNTPELTVPQKAPPQACDSMLDVLDEADVLDLAGELQDEEEAASCAGISGISGELS